MQKIPKPEYPRPQFRRTRWQNLNGLWHFDFDQERRGFKELWYQKHEYSREILVPFVYQSKMSQIESLKLIDCVWYERRFDLQYSLNEEKISNVVLHFGAVDYECNVYINGIWVCYHIGGNHPFSCDVTSVVREKDNKLTVVVEDSAKDPRLLRGKQTTEELVSGIHYEKLTGIWQTVWLEYLPACYLLRDETSLFIDPVTGIVQIETALNRWDPRFIIEVEIKKNDSILNPPCFAYNFQNQDAQYYDPVVLQTQIPKDAIVCWSPSNPELYEIDIIVRDGDADEDDPPVDLLKCYTGAREIQIKGSKMLLNGEELFLASALYQGYFPESLWTPPSDEALKHDLELALEMGYNHLRLHQIFPEPRLYYWADQLGLLVWGEAANAWTFRKLSQQNFLSEWTEIVLRDKSHPSIIGWVPINESWGFTDLKNSKYQREFLRGLYYLTKGLDHTRPVIDNDGWEHVETDIVTVHVYQLPDLLDQIPNSAPPLKSKLEFFDDLASKPVFVGDAAYEGQPVIVTEWGGWGHNLDDPEVEPNKFTAWGYNGKLFKNFDEVLDLYKRYLGKLKEKKSWIKGHCYTEFNDQFQEINGMLTFDRRPKTDLSKLREINQNYLNKLEDES